MMSASIGSVGSNLFVYVEPHNKSLPMTSSSLSMREQCDKVGGVGCHKLHGQQSVLNNVEEVESTPHHKRSKRQIVLPT